MTFVVANLGEESRRNVSVALCDDDCLIGSRAAIAKKMERAMVEDGGENYVFYTGNCCLVLHASEAGS
jgi:hypothetical protein